MAGIVLNINHSFTNGFPIKEDPALTEGSLYLIEPARDSLSEIILTPNNYASRELRNILGQNPESLTIEEQWGGRGYFEKTAKGGLHGITTSGAMNQNQWAGGFLPNDILTFLAGEGLNHSYALFMMGRITQNVAGSTSGFEGVNNNIQLVGTSSRLGTRQVRTSLNIGTDPLTAAEGYLGGSVQGYSLNSWDTILTGSAASNWAKFVSSSNNRFIHWGGRAPASGTGGWGSWVLYRMHLVDLTVANMSFNDVLSLENSVYASRIAPGGRYYEDTWTDPTTFVTN